MGTTHRWRQCLFDRTDVYCTSETPKTAIECPVFLSIQCLLLTVICSSSYFLMMSAGLKHIVRDGEVAGICRPRPAVPLGQATYWGRYSKRAESKKEQVTQLQQKADEEYSHVRAAPETKLAKLLAREIHSLSPLHSPPSSPVAGRQGVHFFLVCA